MRGVLIVNTGSPKTSRTNDVKWFIGEMLSDPQVMSSVPDWCRSILAKNIIAPLRAFRSAAKYRLIWDDKSDESPLIQNTRLLAQKIEAHSNLPVEYAMRYGDPSISDALRRLSEKCPNLHEVVVLPLFPQYAISSYQTVVDAVKVSFEKGNYPFELNFMPPYFDDQEYIHSLAESLKPVVAEEYDRLVFGFHSLPLNHIHEAAKGGRAFDYIYQAKDTVRLVTKELGLNPKKNRVLYSSSIGANWLKPDLNSKMKTYPSKGAKKIIVIMPGFAVDNLETLYDINLHARDIFMKHGGELFHFVPALNAEDYWVEGVIKMITRL